MASMDKAASYEVGAVARLSGVTVRTLHHYDRIGLLTPVARTGAGYRKYGEADLERLQRIRFYRELGFRLDQIKALMDGDGETLAHLRMQGRLLRERIERLERMVVAVEKAMEANTMGISLTPEERFEVFGNFDPEDYEGESKERWGENDSYRESARRMATYTKTDWERQKAEHSAVLERLAAAMKDGLPASSPTAMDAAEEHRAQIEKWFYPCPKDMHVGLGDMYVADPRFTRFFEKVAPGLAGYIHDAILANAARK
jgi:MerR family transcriptional regulator, thiopeptide resistance regulator